MPATVAELTPEELRALIEEIVHDQIIELFGDPEEGLAIRLEVREQLEKQRGRVGRGDLGVRLSAVPRPWSG